VQFPDGFQLVFIGDGHGGMRALEETPGEIAARSLAEAGNTLEDEMPFSSSLSE